MFDDITRTALQRPSRGRGSRRYGFSWFHLVIYLLVVILIWSIRFSQLYIYECVDFAFQVNLFFFSSEYHFFICLLTFSIMVSKFCFRQILWFHLRFPLFSQNFYRICSSSQLFLKSSQISVLLVYKGIFGAVRNLKLLGYCLFSTSGCWVISLFSAGFYKNVQFRCQYVRAELWTNRYLPTLQKKRCELYHNWMIQFSSQLNDTIFNNLFLNDTFIQQVFGTSTSEHVIIWFIC